MSPITFKAVIDAESLLGSFVIALVCLLFEGSPTLAQGTTAISPTMGTEGLGTTTTAHGHTVQITGGTRPDNGTNLFHSFEQFSVGAGDTAQFLNATPSLPTSNILGRVTGGNPSSIFGTIDTMSYPGANLFLMNPAGIVFGPSATLNVGGSVAFTTANYVRLADVHGSNAGIFHADPAATSLLTSASVAAFGFLGSNPSAIAIQGSTLTVQPGKSISLVGGKQGFRDLSGTVPDGVTLTDAGLKAPDGQINIASVASPGEILARNLNQTGNINGETFGTLGTVQISQQSSIDTSGEGGGSILIRGGRLVVNDSTISANTKAAGPNAEPNTSSSGAGIDIQVSQDAIIDNGAVIETNVEPGAHHESGGVRITADHITISGGPKVLDFLKMNPNADILFAGIKSNIEPKSTATRSGDISLNAASSIQIKDYGQVETKTGSTGNAGHIALKASGDIALDSFAIVQSLSENSSGYAGSITFTSSAQNVRISNSFVTSQTIDSGGNAGNIKIEAPHGDIRLTDGTQILTATRGTGTLGGIQIEATNLLLMNQSSISGQNLTTQTPGNIVIALGGGLTLTGGSLIQTGALGSAKAADLIIKAHDILVSEKSFLATDTISSGDAGRLGLFTDNLRLMDGGTLTSVSRFIKGKEIPLGHGGVISVEGFQGSGASVTIDGSGSGIFTSAQGTGAAGDVVVKANSVTIQNGGIISASTTGTDSRAIGGSITVNATDQVALANGGSITASSTGPADAGNISINAGQQLIMQNSKITTEAHHANGGNIKIVAIDRINLANGRITTSVFEGSGDSGKIFIDPNEVVVQNNSMILSQAMHGRGGDITITTPRFLQDTTSLVDASSQFGPSGKVTIQSSISNLSGTVAQLASKPSEIQALLQSRCAALVGGEQSTFIVAGRDALPSEPGGWLSSPLSMEHWTGEDTEHASGPVVRRNGSHGSPPMVAPETETAVLSLRRLTPPGFLVRTFGIDGLTGCRS